MRMCCGIFLVFGILLSIIVDSVSGEYVYVDTSVGNLTGIIKPVKFIGEEVYCSQFLGVPYADPPIGNRRFARPLVYGNYHRTYNATFHRPHCMQSATAYKLMKYFQMNEDCLYLNIYTPGKDVQAKSKNPVMVFIHGGSFSFGGADVFSGEVISSFYDVIVVTLNYRLNVFGFLSDGTKSSGNLGLWDQQLALTWVRDNIKNFGGNPEEVTLFGGSSGAASALFQAGYPRNKRLFKRIIAQSGSFLASWALQSNVSQQYHNFVKDVGCKSVNDVMKCLRSKPARQLTLRAEAYAFAPVVDQEFILMDPAAFFAGDSDFGLWQGFSDLDFMSGVNSAEGGTALEGFSDILKTLSINLTNGLPKDTYESAFVPSLLHEMYGNTVSGALSKSVLHQYRTWAKPDDPIGVRDCAVKLSSDTAFVVPALRNAIMHAKLKGSKNQTSTYFYVFDAKTSHDPEPMWLNGAKHTMELPFVFGFPDSMKRALGLSSEAKINLTIDEKFLSHAMMYMWTSFAKNG